LLKRNSEPLVMTGNELAAINFSAATAFTLHHKDGPSSTLTSNFNSP